MIQINRIVTVLIQVSYSKLICYISRFFKSTFLDLSLSPEVGVCLQKYVLEPWLDYTNAMLYTVAADVVDRFINIKCVLIDVSMTIHETTGISFPES